MSEESGNAGKRIKSNWMIGVLILVFAAVGFIFGLGASGMVNAGGFWEWANTYSGVLSFFASVILVGVTISYVIFTHSMAKASEKSLEQAKEQTKLLSKQIQLDKQPLVIPSITSINIVRNLDLSKLLIGHLQVLCNWVNISNEPALFVFLFGYIEIPKTDGEDTVIMKSSSYRDSALYLMKDGKLDLRLDFTVKRSSPLCKRLGIVFDESGNIIKAEIRCNTPHPKIVITTYYRNLAGQWFKASVLKEIYGFTEIIDKDGISKCKIITENGMERCEIVSHVPWTCAPYIIKDVTLDDFKNDVKKHSDESLYNKLGSADECAEMSK
ncbi:MAG: hypothetical protein Q7J08_00750 [Methanocorpusculum sp.]|nr:hypothetical protein [Methanocorpusculum sp.]